MVDPKLTTFVCSTYRDLIREREAVVETIKGLRLKHESMEFFGARPDRPIETCLSEVRRSDILVIIVAHSYGSIVPDRGISFSEAEYLEGQQHDKLCLVYVRDDDTPLPPKLVESDPDKLRLLLDFRERLSRRHTIAAFSSAEDLSEKVSVDLSRMLAGFANPSPAPTVDDAKEYGAPATVMRTLSRALANGVPESLLIQVIEETIANTASRSHIPSKPKIDFRSLYDRLLKKVSLKHRRTPVAFLSYSHSDSSIVSEFAAALKGEGVNVWRDVDEIAIGERLSVAIAEGRRGADAFVFFLSSDSQESAWVHHEVDYAFNLRLDHSRRAVAIPVLLENVPIPATLRDRKYLDLQDGNINRAAKECADAIKHHVSQRSEI